MTNGKPPRHKLSGVDKDTKTAVCVVCGPTRIHYREGRSSECMTVRSANRRGSPVAEKARRKRAEERNREILEKQRYQYRGKWYGWEQSFTLEDYDRLFAEQGGVCAICDKPEPSRRLATDHDHSTGAVRGLLCMRCNLTIGKFNDDAARFERFAEYLRRAERAS